MDRFSIGRTRGAIAPLLIVIPAAILGLILTAIGLFEVVALVVSLVATRGEVADAGTIGLVGVLCLIVGVFCCVVAWRWADGDPNG